MVTRIWLLVCVLIAMTLAVSACDAFEGDLTITSTPTLRPDLEVTVTSTATPTTVSVPSITIQPESALADEPVQIRVAGLESGQIVTLTAVMNDDRSREWESQATFVADGQGVVDVTTQAPISGTYSGTDPMGLIWSMLPNMPGAEKPYFANWETYTVVVTITAEIEGEQLGPAYFRRIRLPEDVTRTAVSENGLVGVFFTPEGTGPFPTLLVLGGSDGGVDTKKATLLAAHGYAALALAYFGPPSLPDALAEIPLEYFNTAIDWLKSQEAVDKNRIGVVGTSRGGELALLLGATYPDLKAVISYVGSGVVYAGYTRTPDDLRAAWTIDGEPVPFHIPATNNLDEAAIPVERISGPVLLISGGDDQLWPSAELSQIAIDRLRQHNHPYPYEHLVYENAGHFIGPPYWPTGGDGFTHPVSGVRFTAGGTPAADAHANADSWTRVLAFLEQNFSL